MDKRLFLWKKYSVQRQTVKLYLYSSEMKKFDLIKHLVKSLKVWEARTFEKFLNAFDDVKSEDSLKMLKAFRTLRSEEMSEEELRNFISPNYSKEAFNKMMLRLRDRIYDTLTLDSNLFKPEAYSEQYQKKLHVRKLTSVASIVHGRGNLPLAFELYERIIISCKEYEIYDELIETLFIVQQLKGISQGIEVYSNLSDQVEFYNNCRLELMKAKNYYYEISVKQNFAAVAEKEAEKLSCRINELKESVLRTGSSNIEYFLLYLQIHQAQEQEDYESAVNYNNALIHLIKTNKSVYTKRALGSAYLELFHNLLLIHQFRKAVVVAQESLLNFNALNSINVFHLRELLFQCFLYLGDYERAEEQIELLLSNEFQKSFSQFDRSRVVFLKATIDFIQQKFAQVHLALQNCREIENDKEGWNFAIRFLSIFTDIERNLLDQADNKIESLRKFISRSKVPVAERFVIAYRILYQLSKNSFDFSKTQVLNRELFDQLETKHKWKIKTAEIFPFEGWFQSKIDGKPYRFTISEPRLLKKVINEN